MKSEVTQIPPSDFAVMSDFNNLYQSYLDARKGKRWKMAVVRYEVNALENTMFLHYMLTSKKYRPSPYNTFLIHEPKERVIMYNGFKDKIVQHMVTKVFLSLYPADIPADAVLHCEVTNNPFDTTPVWEDISSKVGRFVHIFQNTTAAKGYGLAYRFTITKGGQTVEVVQATVRFA